MFKISQSKVKTWQRCRQAYHYKYFEKLTKKRKSRPLLFGSLVHGMIEAHANGDEPFEWLKEATNGVVYDPEEYGNLVEDVETIMGEYFAYYPAKSLKYLRLNKRNSEHEFEFELLPGVLATGKIDAFARTATGQRALVEHKSFNQMPNEDTRWRNVQSPFYQYATHMMGWPAVDNVCWDYIWSKPPKVPEFLKSGKLSTRAIETLPTRLAQFFAEHELDPREHPELVENAKASRKNWFQRIFSGFRREMTDRVVADIKETAIDMLENHGKRKARTIDRHCSWCDFEPLCRGELQGLDVDFIKEREYVRKIEQGDTEEPRPARKKGR